MPRKNASTTKSKETHDSVEVVFRSFLSTSGALRSKMREYFTRFGISGVQWGVMRVIRKAEDEEGQIGVRLTDIGRRVLITPPSVTGVVNRLERQGWVKRIASKDDQRAKLVALTPLGRQMIERLRTGHRAQVHSVMAGLSKQELRDLHRLLNQMTRHIESIPPA